MKNEPVIIRFTLDSLAQWTEARGNDIAYKTCFATANQVARVKANSALCLRPSGKNVRVCKVKSAN